jgi:phage shock protein C
MQPESEATQSQTTSSPNYGGYRPPLRRSVRDRMLTGVAGGVAEYMGIDPTIVRIGFAILTLVGGAGIPLYLAAFLLIPEEGSEESVAASLIQSFHSR